MAECRSEWQSAEMNGRVNDSARGIGGSQNRRAVELYGRRSSHMDLREKVEDVRRSRGVSG